MKKLTAIFFLTAYLLSTTELHQLLKLSMVFEHYSQHQKEDRNISFLAFLEMHYLHGSPKDADYNEDMKLPFKTAEDCVALISPVIVPQPIHIAANYPVQAAKKELYIPRDQFISSAYLSCIWQPPKHC